MNYHELQVKAYEWLSQKYKKDPEFTFSVRQKASKGAEKNYFIGTEKSRYFSTTFWNIPVSYPGSSTDLINLVFALKNNHRLSLYIQFYQTKEPDSPQNQYALELIRNIKERVKAHHSFNYKSGEGKKMEYFTVFLPHHYESLEEAEKDLDTLIKEIMPIIDEEILHLKSRYPEFKAHRFTAEEQDKMLSKMAERRDKYSNPGEAESSVNWNILEDFENWYINKYDQNTGIYQGMIFGFLYQIVHFKKLISEERLDNYDFLTLQIIIKAIPDFDYEGLDYFEDFLHQTLNKFKNSMKQPVNQILYGPPGTGKTYHTINKAIGIANPEFNFNQDRQSIKKEYDRLCDNGQVAFTTFHQNMSYEDFIEGIKPIVDEDPEGNKTVIYDVEDGIFKKIVSQAKKMDKIDQTGIDWNNVNYYKMSLGGKNNPQEHSYCIYNNLGGISWGGNNDLTELAHITDWNVYRKKFLERFPNIAERSKFHIQASYSLLRMKEGDIVIATRGNHIIDAIGKVTGGYTFNDENPTSLLHFRKIDWFAKDLNVSPEKFLRKNISQQSIYQFYKEDIKLDSFMELTAVNENSPKNYVLIIDEINRGNVSQIFGELITLIEESKRLGNPEELEVVLPYSKEKFGVPSNVFIIGTMNTADRSIEALDTALRRRFCFEEMLPKTDLLSPSAMYCRLLWDYKDVGWTDAKFERKENNLFDLLGVQEDLKKERKNIWKTMNNDNEARIYRNNYFEDFTYTGINLENLLNTINKRIEILLDRDHTIGHSYFIGVNSFEDLNSVFKNNIIPLLQEYFYGDYEKIALVLGEGFVDCVEAKQNNVKFAKWTGKNIESPEILRTFRLKKDISDINNAVRLLLNA